MNAETPPRTRPNHWSVLKKKSTSEKDSHNAKSKQLPREQKPVWNGPSGGNRGHEIQVLNKEQPVVSQNTKNTNKKKGPRTTRKHQPKQTREQQ